MHRHDADLFDAIIAAGPAIPPDYGDYGIGHPALPTGAPRGPLPNLRYASGRDWQVFRESKALPGNQSFFTLCDRVTHSQHWPGAGYSAGDSEILRCAQSLGGAGTATQWLQFGASHHVAHVIDRLTTHGAP